MKDFTNNQKVAILAYLAASKAISDYEKEHDDFANMIPVYKAIDGMRDSGLESFEVDYIITNRDEVYEMLTA